MYHHGTVSESAVKIVMNKRKQKSRSKNIIFMLFLMLLPICTALSENKDTIMSGSVKELNKKIVF